ncbi:MAG: hypothetical protein JO104_10565, partial [Candidatus Eremiobacteraeota bacterium]|nr:hypothetical protein [Candidatus Eremiobacteraeota bacterium]
MQLAIPFALRSAGSWTTVVVAVSGFTLGFFGWYALLVPTHRPTLVAIGLPLGLLFGTAGALWSWTWYSAYFAERTGIVARRSLQYDAISWSAFLLLWLAFVLPIWFTHGGVRLFFYCFAAFCIAKLAVAARFNATVRDVTVDFIVTRFAIIVIAELAAVSIGQRAGT